MGIYAWMSEEGFERLLSLLTLHKCFLNQTNGFERGLSLFLADGSGVLNIIPLILMRLN